ncbi:MAG: hypothetical protein ACERKD_01450 [Prolixibacteraceae bacterium]
MAHFRNNPIIQVLVLLSLLISCTNTGNNSTKGKYENELLYSNFIDPPNNFRSHPFYSLNDLLDTTEIRIQIEGFKDAGFGGFYLHSRDGLLTEFLGDEWWQNMTAAVKAGNKTGLHTMFYDEDKWPSGFAGGIIPQMNEKFRAKCLARISINTPTPEGSVVLKSDEHYHYIEYTAQMGNAKFNGTTYVDLMNPNMVQAFIDVAYKPYIEKYSGDIKSYTPAIFSDEPHIHARYFDRYTPNLGLYSYSPFVRTKFQELFNYDFIDKVNLLFEEKENWREVRLQYHQAVALQFEESFTQQIAAYCEANGFKYTGHYLAEDVLQKVRDRAGNTMLHYRNMQQPGMDLLGLGFENKLITARALSSVANQYTIPRRLSELYGTSGQNMNFEDRKWLAGWHTINGVNHLCPHLTLYSMKGLRKRDYPPTFSYQQPYFKYNKQLEDYLGRISYAATIGEYAPQILVINPLESEFIKGDNDGEFTRQTINLLETLQKTHYDYDLGDEQIMHDIAKLKGKQLQIGAMTYDAVVLPDMIELRKSTIKLLLEFSQTGGKIIYCGRFPEFADGQLNSSLLKDLYNASQSISLGNLSEQLPLTINPQIKINNDHGEVWSHVRKVKNGNLIQLYNTNRTTKIRFTIHSSLIDSSTVLWNPSEAKCYQTERAKDGKIELEIEPSSVIWLTSGELSKDAQNIQVYQLTSATEKLVALNENWLGQRLNPNSITLDFARYSTDRGKTFSSNEPVIGIFDRLNQQDYNGDLWLQFILNIEDRPSNVSLSVEQPEMYSSITVNNQAVGFDKNSYFIDHAFPVGKIDDYLIEGENKIDLQLNYKAVLANSQNAAERYGTEIENIYVLGDFGVSAKHINTREDSERNQSGNFQNRPVYGLSEFSIVKEEKTFQGDLTIEGYPFYAGEFELEQIFNLEDLEANTAYFVDFPNCEAINIKVEINGNPSGILSWAPYRLNITNQLRQGQNTIKVTLVNSLRNLLGPHHQQRAELIHVGPFSFRGSGGFPDPRGDADWYDIRKTKEPMRLWSDTYYCIPFGFIDAPIILKDKRR